MTTTAKDSTEHISLDSPPDAPMVASERAGLSIVIPAYNEENGIGPVLDELEDEIEALHLDIPVEVIIVDDGSSDDTAQVAEEHADDVIRVVRHEHNKGYGAALKTGINAADHDWILITDADGTYPNEHIPDVLAERDDHDMVVGARTGERRNVPLIRRPPKWALRMLASYLSQENIPDLNSGFRLMRKEEVRKFYNILPNGFSFTTTITLAMFSSGLRVKYVPINYEKREGKSHIRPIYDTINFVKLIIRTILYFDPLRVFIPISALFFVASVAVAVGSYVWLDQVMDVTTVLLFITSAQFLALGMIADMLNRRLA